MSNKDRTIHIQSSHYSQIPISDNTAEYKRVIQFLEEKIISIKTSQVLGVESIKQAL